MDIEKIAGTQWITVRGAREHNLKNITVAIPKERVTVITGPSGSGKSTLALDILYAEGQRRYIESLASYARQFLGVPQKPQVDSIEGLCPAIAIDQKTVGNNPRSTVGTITEIYDYIRVLFARIGQVHCPTCGHGVKSESPESIARRLITSFVGKTITIAAPIVNQKKGEFSNELEKLFLEGFYRFSINNKYYSFKNSDEIRALGLKKTYKHSIDLLIDSFELTNQEETQLYEALERSFSLAQGLVKITVDGQEYLYSSQRMCLSCARSFPEIEPRLFSFNSPQGACKSCYGLGMAPYDTWEIFTNDALDRWEAEKRCVTCKGTRLNDLALAVTVGNSTIYEISELSVKQALLFFDKLVLSETEQIISKNLCTEIISRYRFLDNVGLSYLTLNRTARTLSGGESQRIRLATQLGSSLSGVLYVLDEPSIGLHQRDNDRLLATVKKLRDAGNTVIVVEHDTDTMRHADYVIDMGPAAGVQGGMVIAYGTPDQVSAHPESLTGAYLAGRKSITRTGKLRKATRFMTVTQARKHNLKNLTVKFPLGVLCGVSGVSGSGKSTLIMEELVPALRHVLKLKSSTDKLSGAESLENLIVIDQSPIGRTPRSNPATYLGIFDDIRKLFAGLPESTMRGYTAGRFSFNVAAGRCARCGGDGTLTISMHFLPDVIMPCDQCKGLRYNKQTLEITYKNKNIAQILAMTALEARDFFVAHSGLKKRLELLCQVGLDYIKLGQSSLTLSGGEAQRIKLVEELAKRGTNTLYILDEPTTGLHSSDIEKLLAVLNRLVDKGNSIIIIEHNIDVLKTVDYVIDMGPEGGDEGGMIIAQGTPEEVACVVKSATGFYLKKVI